MFVVQKGRWHGGDEELGAVAVGAGVLVGWVLVGSRRRCLGNGERRCIAEWKREDDTRADRRLEL